MSKLRRFRVLSLKNLRAGDSVPLPPDEAKHARVLRLDEGAAVHVFDGSGLSASGTLTTDLSAVKISELYSDKIAQPHLTLAVAWPKGKRAAVLVEKCTELGVDRIQPVRFARAVVSKDNESEGVMRLNRIAAEAAKQCGRDDVPEILPEIAFSEALKAGAADGVILVCDPKAEHSLAAFLFAEKEKLAQQSLYIVVGPEGGFTADELAAALAAKIPIVKLARNVLRIETAALTICALVRGTLF